MDFKEATDSLFDRVSHERLAEELDVSVASVRQARLKPTAGAHRAPPPRWEEAVARLAAGQIERYRLLLESLENSTFTLDTPVRHRGDKGANRAKSTTH